MRIGIAGAGGMGNVHARHLTRMPDVELYFYELDPARSNEFGMKYGAIPCASLESLVKAVDIVDICLPSDLHLRTALVAINAGKSLFIEKPVTRTCEEGRRLLSEARKAKVKVGVGQVVRYFPEFRTGHKLVKEGKVGTPSSARTHRGGGMPGKGAAWFADHKKSGGVLIDLAIHDFDWLRWTLGEVSFLFSRSVGATTQSGPDYALTTLTFDSGVVAHVESTWMDPSGFRTSYEICGDGGMIDFDSRQSATLKTSNSTGTVSESPYDSADDPYYNELKDFVGAITKGEEPPVTLQDGLMALSIAEAAVESAQTGKVIKPSRDF